MRSLLQSARGRTIVGFVIGVLFIPVMLGVSACLETPIGDPEKGWVDPRVSGVWMGGDPDPEEFNAILWLFEPYDSRTWLVTWVGLGLQDQEEEEAELPAEEAPIAGEGGSEAAGAPPPADEVEAAARLLTDADVLHILETLDDERVESQGVFVFKAWLTSIADRRFLVLEPKAAVNDEKGFGLGAWFVYRLVLRGDRMELAEIDGGVDGLSGVKTRGEAEQIIVDRIADPELYEEPASLYRIPQASYDEVDELLGRAGVANW